MEFEWDELKSEANRIGRGFGFDFAALIFDGPTLEGPDDRKDYGELRIRAIGEVEGFVLAVVYTDREPVRRIISARLASRKERALWQAFASR
ncbi:BrnT family toxin [Bosea thiooxidans]